MAESIAGQPRKAAGPALADRRRSHMRRIADLPLASQPLEELTLPAQQGIYAACVIGGTGSGVWQPPAYATMRLRQLDDTDPSVTPSLDTRETDNGTEVRPEYVPWELVFIYVKYGSAAGTDCNVMSGYQRHLNNRWYVVYNANETWRFCAYGTDLAENAGPTATFDFPSGVKTTDSSSKQ